MYQPYEFNKLRSSRMLILCMSDGVWEYHANPCTLYDKYTIDISCLITSRAYSSSGCNMTSLSSNSDGLLSTTFGPRGGLNVSLHEKMTTPTHIAHIRGAMIKVHFWHLFPGCAQMPSCDSLVLAELQPQCYLAIDFTII